MDWDPADHDNAIDTEWAADQLFGYLTRYRLTSLTLDQFNGRAIADSVRRRVREAGVNWRPVIECRQTTRTENYQRAETFKRLAYAGRISAFPHLVARDELLCLRDNHGRVEAPTTGRITKDDLAIAMINAVAIAMEPYQNIIYELGALKPRLYLSGGLPTGPPEATVRTVANGRFERNRYADDFSNATRRRSPIWAAPRRYYPGPGRFRR